MKTLTHNNGLWTVLVNAEAVKFKTGREALAFFDTQQERIANISLLGERDLISPDERRKLIKNNIG